MTTLTTTPIISVILTERRQFRRGDGLSWVTDVTGHDLFFSCPLYFVPHSFSSSYFLPPFHWLISILLLPCASVWENTRACVSHFSIAILNGTCSLRASILLCGDVPAIKQLNYSWRRVITTTIIAMLDPGSIIYHVKRQPGDSAVQICYYWFEALNEECKQCCSRSRAEEKAICTGKWYLYNPRSGVCKNRPKK